MHAGLSVADRVGAALRLLASGPAGKGSSGGGAESDVHLWLPDASPGAHARRLEELAALRLPGGGGAFSPGTPTQHTTLVVLYELVS